MSDLKAGTARVDITPAPGTPQGGWGAQTHQRGLGADLPLYATALVLSGSDTEAAIIDVDSIGFDSEWTGKIIDAVANLTKIPREHIRFSCTHTHSGPNTFRLSVISEGLDMVLSYLDGLPLRIASAVWQAQRNMAPVRCSAAEGKCEINVNRRFKLPDGRIVVGRNWQGPRDSSVRVLRLDRLDEEPAATIVHYSCHATTMAWQCQYFTPDFPGVVRQVVEQNLGGTCLFLQGAAGNLTPRRGFTGDPRTYRLLGKKLGLEATRIAAGIETLPRRERLETAIESGTAIAVYTDEPIEPLPPILRVSSRFLSLPLKRFPPSAELESQAQAAQAELDRLRAEGSEEEIRAATARATQAMIRADRARLHHGKTHVDWQLQCIRIGDTALLSIPGEPFNEIGQQIVANSPFAHTFFSGYSNGGFGYLPVRTAFEEGGYEVEASPFSPDSAEIVVQEGSRMLEVLARDDK